MSHALRAFVAVLAVCLIAEVPGVALAQDTYTGYTSLDATEPISFDGKIVEWGGNVFTLDANTFFLDYRLDEDRIANNPHAFNRIQDALETLTDGTAEKPMLLLTAPGVYWVDDPDDPEIRVPAPGSNAPVGAVITANHLYFYGLSSNPENVVYACNRGQTQGSSGNFTMFRVDGVGLKSENVTFGNYCNVDLEFPLAPELGREKRAEAIAQAQLISYRSPDGVAINSQFISRLNLLPFATTYLNCHLESSGHASFFNGIYIGCTLEFYGTNFSRGRFFDCDIYLTPFVSNFQGRRAYTFGFVDGRGSDLVCVDTRIHRSQELVDAGVQANVAWGRAPLSPTARSYQSNVTLDGAPYVIQSHAMPEGTVVMAEGSDLLKAYKIQHDGTTYYNVANMLSGFDPFHYTDAIKAAAVSEGKPEDTYLRIPMSATLALERGSDATIRSGQTEAVLRYGVTPTEYGNSSSLGAWTFTTEDPNALQYVRITDNENGRLTVAGTNDTQDAVDVIVVGKNGLGLEAAVELTIEPSYLDAPVFVRDPAIQKPEGGVAKLDYALDLNGLTEESLITWYRCKDAQGGDALKVAVSRLNKPETAYVLSDGDVGSYLMAVIQPKHQRSDPGDPKTAYSSFKVAAADVVAHGIDTDFTNLPADPQPLILPATWTLDGYFSPDCYDDSHDPPSARYTANPDAWSFGTGGSRANGLESVRRGARMFYAPQGSGSGRDFGDMSVQARFAPGKTSGAGFGSATDQFLDVFIKFDLAGMNGYALRIERLDTTEIESLGFNGDGAVAGCAFSLIKYEGGKTTHLTQRIMSSAFTPVCLVDMKVADGKLMASVTSTDESRGGDLYGYPREVHLETEIVENGLGGTGALFTGTTGGNGLRVLSWKTDW